MKQKVEVHRVQTLINKVFVGGDKNGYVSVTTEDVIQAGHHNLARMTTRVDCKAYQFDSSKPEFDCCVNGTSRSNELITYGPDGYPIKKWSNISWNKALIIAERQRTWFGRFLNSLS